MHPYIPCPGIQFVRGEPFKSQNDDTDSKSQKVNLKK
jgi:hypothetical protein